MKIKAGLIGLTLFSGQASAQITGSGNFQSIPALFSQILGINVSNPYNVLGVLATFAVMWVSAYVIFKIAITKLDGDTRRGGFADSLGIKNKEDTNLLAVLTLLITLTLLGTGAFYGLIRGWQSMILLMFTFMLIAGILFVLIGGSGLLFGGGSYLAGKAAKSTIEGVNEVREASEMISTEEDDVEEIEKNVDEEEDDIKDREERGEGKSRGGEDEGGGSTVERELEDVIRKIERSIQLIEDIEGLFDESLEQEIENMKNDLQTMKRILQVLGVEEGSEGLDALKNVIRRADFSEGEIKDLFDPSRSSDSAKEFYEDLIGRERPLSISTSEAESIRDYIEEIEGLKRQLEVLKANAQTYRGLEQLLDRLEGELEHLEDEESALENLLSHLGTASREMFEEVKKEKDELRNIESNLQRIEQLDETLANIKKRLESLEDRLGEFEGTESIFNALDLRRLLAETVADSGSSDVKSSKFVNFDPDAEGVSLSPGVVLLSSGESETVVEVDMDMSAGGFTSKKPFEFSDVSRGLISMFEDEMEDYITSHSIRGKKDVERELFNLFSHLNNQFADKNSGDFSGRLKISNAFESPSFDSRLVNTIFLGFLVYNFRPIYDHILTEAGDPDSHIGAWRPVRNVMNDAHVSLGMYRTSSGLLPCIFVDTEASDYCFCPSTGEVFSNVESDRIGKTRFIVNRD